MIFNKKTIGLLLYLACLINVFNSNLFARMAKSSYSLVPYNKHSHKKCLTLLLQDCYILNRIISPEEISNINRATGFLCKTAKNILLFGLSHPQFLPSKTFLLKNNNQIIGFVTLMTPEYNEQKVYEICYFNFAKEYTLSEEAIFNMLSLIKEKALQENIGTIRIDLQKNAWELSLIPFLEKFGFSFEQHTYIDNGFTGFYII